MKTQTYGSTTAWSASLGATQIVLTASIMMGFPNLSPSDVLFLFGCAPVGGLAGALIGSVIWLKRPRRSLTRKRLFLTRALLGSVLTLGLMALCSGTYGAIYGAGIGPHTGDGPGLGGALFAAILTLVILGIPGILFGGIIGGVSALIAGHKPNPT